MERKHVHADSVVYIGKEANNIDEQVLDVKKAQEFVDVEEIKKRIRESEDVNLCTPAVRRLEICSKRK